MPCISLTSEALTRRGKAEPWSLPCGAPSNGPVCPNLEASQTGQSDGKMERVPASKAGHGALVSVSVSSCPPFLSLFLLLQMRTYAG